MELKREIREATTGRIVAMLPQVWAVAEIAAEAGRAPQVVETSPRVEPSRSGDAKGFGSRPRPELAFYRKYTEAMLRRYVQMSMETGRVPSMLGREMFRGKVTSYRVTSFEDVVIFCLDMDRCLAKLGSEEAQLVKRIALQEYTQGEAAGMLGLSLRACILKYGQALDRLTGMFLENRMLEPLGVCQGGE